MEGSANKPRCPFSRPQTLINYESSKEATDVLHMKADDPGVCTSIVCKGSLMGSRKISLENRQPSEVLQQAKEFLDEYYKETKRFESKEHQARLQEVTQKVIRTGTYDLTLDELEFGAKLAWRNAPRCIGRISWNTLHVFDGRNVKTAKEMFALMVKHLDYATNGGNIRSTITVFPPRKVGQRDFRVWNQQLIAFAGYEQPDGTVIGDPAHKEFTKICQELGWKGKGGQFDILPWVVSTPTGEPEWFDIPEESVLLVHLKHPEYKWFEELNIKWFCVPAVSSMMLDCGGLQFSAAPFNGWYMASEIATRDLCDVQRYNLLPMFGEKLGLDTKSPASLWKDKATLEMNIAVLHSFKEKEVTIVDHHTAAETFMQFHSNEYRQRGGCPSDWVWIVPPISGSLTPVFHQEMTLYYLKPSYEYQIPAWVALQRQNKMLSGEDTKTGNSPIQKFRRAALCVYFATTLYSGALAKRIRIAIIYASETGKAQGYANNLYESFSRRFNPEVICMDDYDISRLSSETMVVMLASTTGVGEPPQNGKEFTRKLYELRERGSTSGSHENFVSFWDDYNDIKVNGISAEAKSDSGISSEEKLLSRKNRGFFSRLVRKIRRRKSLDIMDSRQEGYESSYYLSTTNLYKSTYSLAKSTNSLFRNLNQASDVTYAVFALGSTNYKHFCAFGKYVDHLMFTLGGDRILDLTCGNETENQQDTFNSWANRLLQACCDRFQVEHCAHEGYLGSQVSSSKHVKFVERNNPVKLTNGFSGLHKKKVESCIVTGSQPLFQDGHKWYHKLTVDTGNNPSLQYEVGDNIGIFPSNNSSLVHGILEKLNNCKDPDMNVEIFIRKQEGDSWLPHPNLPVSSIRILLKRYLDITTPPSQELLKLMASGATNNKQRSRLNLLATDIDEYRTWRKENYPNLLEVLNEFPGVKIDIELLLCRLPLLQPRLYSISSSPDLEEGELTLTVASFNYRTRDGKGVLHEGVSTSYIRTLKPRDRIELFHKSVPEFHLPDEGRSPIILIGAGSGVAPLRGIWQHYHYQYNINHTGQRRKITLYFGCQTRANNLYAEEKAAMCRAKVLKETYLALSREPKMPKTYVQDLLLVNGKEVYKQLVVKEGHVYICGSESMADGVSMTLLSIIQDHGKKTLMQAKNVIQKMKDEHRYHEEVFGNGSTL
ncbi:nitric oxide synthase, salivary gland-like [Macrobrachium nipponense]|uniref:nitric oxide synthase, salivary gland-like n=1 Tax=Macrobrachium nipponense TaxID=159736 RepID=UPI0030C8B974